MASSSGIISTEKASSSSSSSINDLPYDVLTNNIFARLAADLSISDFHKIRFVSKRFHSLSYDPTVLQRASLDCSRLPWHYDYKYFQRRYHAEWPLQEDQYEKFVVRCVDSRNPHALEALFDLGIGQFFSASGEDFQHQCERGFQNLAYAAEKGLEDAIRYYGLILIALGDEHRAKGYTLLAPYIITLTPDEVEKFEAKWYWYRRHPSDTPSPDLQQHIKTMYVRDNCQCNGLTCQWLTWNFPNRKRFVEFEGMPTSMACVACQWHESIIRFFRLRFI